LSKNQNFPKIHNPLKNTYKSTPKKSKSLKKNSYYRFLIGFTGTYCCKAPDEYIEQGLCAKCASVYGFSIEDITTGFWWTGEKCEDNPAPGEHCDKSKRANCGTNITYPFEVDVSMHDVPSLAPTATTVSPSAFPSAPSVSPTIISPSFAPSISPSFSPSKSPSRAAAPSISPSFSPSKSSPSLAPSKLLPSDQPTAGTPHVDFHAHVKVPGKKSN